jgi:hypothetical protein
MRAVLRLAEAFGREELEEPLPVLLPVVTVELQPTVVVGWDSSKTAFAAARSGYGGVSEGPGAMKTEAATRSDEPAARISAEGPSRRSLIW